MEIKDLIEYLKMLDELGITVDDLRKSENSADILLLAIKKVHDKLKKICADKDE